MLRVNVERASSYVLEFLNEAFFLEKHLNFHSQKQDYGRTYGQGSLGAHASF